MKRKTFASLTLGLLALLALPAFAEIEDTKVCTDGVNNALAVFDALYGARGQAVPSNAKKLEYVEEILTHAGVDVTQFNNAEKGCMFVVGVVWRDARDRYIAARRAARQEDVQATVDTNVAADLAEFDTPQ